MYLNVCEFYLHICATRFMHSQSLGLELDLKTQMLFGRESARMGRYVCYHDFSDKLRQRSFAFTTYPFMTWKTKTQKNWEN